MEGIMLKFKIIRKHSGFVFYSATIRRTVSDSESDTTLTK